MTITVTKTSATLTASAVPSIYDVIINGNGYIFARNNIDNLSTFGHSHRALFGHTPTFLPRTNISGDYGDNNQDFFLTAPQRDWSMGEGRKFSQRSVDTQRQFWQGSNIDVTVPGQVTLRQATKSLTFAAAVRAVCPRGATVNQDMIAASATNLYEIDAAGTITDKGAHSLGAAPAKFGMTTDGANVYLSTTEAGTVGIRKWTGSVYSTWSATQADTLEFLNNTVYGFRADTAVLSSYDTSGTATTLFTWKDGSGTARGGSPSKIKAFGGKLLILWGDGPNGPELWQYDGTGTSLIAQFPKTFYAYDLEVSLGVIYISGSNVRISNGSTSSFVCSPIIYFYANGQIGLLWGADTDLAAVSAVSTAGHPSVVAYGSGIVFNDDTRGTIEFWDLAQSGYHSIATYAVAGTTPLLAASQQMLLHTRNQTTGYLYPDTTTLATSGYVNSSLYDFNNSLNKYFKSVTIDANIPTGASIDLAYQTDTLDGAYTSVVTSAVSGTEYTIGTNAHSLSLQATLNKGTAATSPTLKKTMVRAVPILSTYKTRTYLIDLSGKDGKVPVVQNDASICTRDGQTMAAELVAALGQTVTIIDEFGTFTGIIDPANTEFIRMRTGEYYGHVEVREV